MKEYYENYTEEEGKTDFSNDEFFTNAIYGITSRSSDKD